jgi:hypothetical protein
MVIKIAIHANLIQFFTDIIFAARLFAQSKQSYCISKTVSVPAYTVPVFRVIING